MSYQVEGQDCPICKSHLFEDDDVVVCPVCGAPHHRSCYQSLGHCGLEALHGTPEQYRSPVAKEAEEEAVDRPHCANCGFPLSGTGRYCPRCGRPVEGDSARSGSAQPPYAVQFRGISVDPLGGVPPREEFDGIPAIEVAKFVNVNTPRYLPVFRRLQQGKKLSWNWAAFLFPEGWLFYRKCYKEGFLFLLLSVLSWALTMPFLVFVSGLPVQSNVTMEQMYALVASAVEGGQVTLGMMAATYAGLLLMLVYRILCGILGDRMYKTHCLEKIHTMREELEDYEEFLPRYGSVSLVLLVVFFFISQYIPNLLLSFLL